MSRQPPVGGDETRLRQASAALRGGDWRTAMALCEQVPAGSPGYARARQSLGLAEFQRGNYRVAVLRYREALAVEPCFPQCRCNLGNALLHLGSDDDAAREYRQALEAAPELLEAQFNLAIIAERQKDWSAAAAAYRRVLQLRPGFAPAVGRLAAVELLAERLSGTDNRTVMPASPGRWRNCPPAALLLAAEMLEAARDFEAAAELAEAATVTAADDAAAWGRLARLHYMAGRYVEALDAYRRAYPLAPLVPDLFNGYASSLTVLGYPEAAIELLDRTLKAVADAQGYTNLGNALRSAGRLTEALQAFDQSLAINDAREVVWSNRMLLQLARDTVDAGALLDAARRYGERFSGGRPVPAADAMTPRQGAQALVRRAGVLRVGVLSADLNRHPVGYFLRGLFAGYDRGRLEIHGYLSSGIEDGLTEEIRGVCAGWRRVLGEGDERVRELIRGDGIDVLLEASGHTGGNRLPVLAERVAPVQLSFLGYAGTTGMPGFDGRIVDWHTDPAGSEAYSTEPLLRMEGSYFCYGGAQYLGLRASRRRRRAGEAVVFGYFGQRSKVTDTAIRQWLLALGAHAGSKMVVRCQCFVEEASVRAFHAQVGRLGGDPSRFEARGWEAREAYAGIFDEVDVVLNSYPFHLATNMCDALLCGVPVVSWVGGEHRSRMGLSIATAAGVPQYCGADEAGYLAAIEAALRDTAGDGHARLADNVARSPLTDGPGFARRLAAVIESAASLEDSR
jgi:protein O-GlcNAc transferase